MKLLKITLVLIIFSSSLFAQNIYEFLRLDLSPRTAALAGSFVAGNDDPNIIFYNPAGINSLEGRPISVSYVNHLLDINFMGVAYSQKFEGWGRFAAGIAYINYGSFTESDEFGNRFGNFGAGDLLFSVGYANELDKNFYYGANVKFIYSSIAEYFSTGFALDLGLYYEIPDKLWSFGFSILNAGMQISSYAGVKEDLPLDVRLGFSKGLTHTPFRFFFSINRLNGSYDSFADRFNHLTAGVEVTLGKSMVLRFGYDNEKRKDLRISSTTGLAGINLGLGFKISEYKFDYSFSSMGAIGSLHRIGISTSF